MKKHMKIRHFEDDKLLFVGDSIASKANIKFLERASMKSIIAVNAYSSVRDDRSFTPNENFLDVVENELKKNTFKSMVLAGGSTDITNLNTKDNPDPKTLREAATVTAQNLFCIAETALVEHPSLEKVIIAKNTPRFDSVVDDPSHLKPHLSQLVDSIFFGFWCESINKDRIVIGDHSLEEWSARHHDQIYGTKHLPAYDGIHMRGAAGSYVYTKSLLNIFKKAAVVQSHPGHSPAEPEYNPLQMVRQRIQSNRLSSSRPSPSPSDNVAFPAPSFPSSTAPHSALPASRPSVIKTPSSSPQSFYTIPVSNPFEILGN